MEGRDKEQTEQNYQKQIDVQAEQIQSLQTQYDKLTEEQEKLRASTDQLSEEFRIARDNFQTLQQPV